MIRWWCHRVRQRFLIRIVENYVAHMPSYGGEEPLTVMTNGYSFQLKRMVQ